MSRLLAVLLLLAPSAALAQDALVQPYLQLADSSEITIRWETTNGTESRVAYGPTAALGSEETGDVMASGGGSVLHSVTLTGLTEGATVHYQASSDSWTSAPSSFVVPTADPASLRLVAMSDMQRDGGNPGVLASIVQQGVIPYVAAETSLPLPESVQGVLIPGDLVDTGWDYDSWADEFFTPAAPLFAQVPVYPVPGNHENDSQYFFDYFDLPDTGTTGVEEHWWWHDIGNVRVIGLDSNSGYINETQLSWLDGVLSTTCALPDVDFVVAQLHHPFKSELWLPGESLWSGLVVARLEEFSTSCGKPSVHLFGHTHGYSRGQSRDAAHLWVNVATAGGNIDYWGEYAQNDYPEFVTSQDEWGFALIDVTGGDEPTLRLRRISQGNEDLPRDNELRDDVTVKTVNGSPSTPEALAPAGSDAPAPEATILLGSAYADPDGDPHGASHWQIAADCSSFDAPLRDVWAQHRNEYFGQDLQADDDLTDAFVDDLDPETDYCWRLRYRDQALGWSDWSAPVLFRTAQASFTANLLSNPGAEDGTDDWDVVRGVFESLESGECNGVAPHSGERYFAVGGLCESSDVGEARQRVSLALYADRVDDDRASARMRGWLSDWGNDDEPAIQLIFVDADGAELGRSEPVARAVSSWGQVEIDQAVPVGTRSIDAVLLGTRNAGEDNDSYIDDVELRLRFDAPGGDDDDSVGDDDNDSVGDDDDDGGSTGCDCAGGSGSGTLMLPLLLGLGLRRRYSSAG